MPGLSQSLPTRSLPPSGGSGVAVDPGIRGFQRQPSSPSSSAAGLTPKCPIRLLDQQSPEEVAQYFEKHKHDLPRSHEVCVKRHQSNTESIRQLDAKYGSLVHMIQGLGAKHQPLLPDKTHGADAAQAAEDTNEKVVSWVRRVSGSMQGEESAALETDGRENHFDRTMKEVRLGESPSRPWGFQVPLAEDPAFPPSDAGREPSEGYGAAADAESRHRVSPQVPRSGDQKGRQQTTKPEAHHESRATFLQSPSAVHQAPQMVFTGPVFLGYPLEQATALLQQSLPGENAPGAQQM